MQKRGCILLKAKQKIRDYVITLTLAVLIIGLGFLAINVAYLLIPDYKNSIVTVDTPISNNMMGENKGVNRGYPWDILDESKLYTGEHPTWLLPNLAALNEYFPNLPQMTHHNMKLYYDNGVYITDNITLGYPYSMDKYILRAAFKEDGTPIGFDLENTKGKEISPIIINECYKAISDSADYHKLNGSGTVLTTYCKLLLSGMFLPQYTDTAVPNSPSSNTVYNEDPLTDFYFSYCHLMSKCQIEIQEELPISQIDAANIIALIQLQANEIYHKNGRIYLIYDNPTLGRLSLWWDVESAKLAGMAYLN